MPDCGAELNMNSRNAELLGAAKTFVLEHIFSKVSASLSLVTVTPNNSKHIVHFGLNEHGADGNEDGL